MGRAWHWAQAASGAVGAARRAGRPWPQTASGDGLHHRAHDQQRRLGVPNARGRLDGCHDGWIAFRSVRAHDRHHANRAGDSFAVVKGMAHLTGADSVARAARVQSMFARIAGRYDLMNRLMTAGQDVGWRRLTLDLAQLPVGGRLLDLGTGTGELALEALRRDPA